jgi:hypothetical protein
VLIHETVGIRNCPTYCEGVGSIELKFKPVIVTEYVAPEEAMFFEAKGNAWDRTGASKANTGLLVPQTPDRPMTILVYLVADVYTDTVVCDVHAIVIVAMPPTIAVCVTSATLKFNPKMVTESAMPFSAALEGDPAVATGVSYEKRSA